jgi:phenylalanyl-tRNA synthetase beta chain
VAHAGGEPEEGLVDVGDVVRPAPVRLPLGEAERLVGVAYTAEDVTGALAQVGCSVAPAGADDVVEVTPPTWRPDLLQAADLVEEVARLHGYDAIGSELPRALPGTAGQGGLPPRRRAVRAVTRALVAAGLVEVLSYPFVAPGRADELGLPADDERRHALRLLNPLREEEPLLRTSLLATLPDTLRRNVGRGAEDVALLEVGAVTRPGPHRDVAPPPSPSTARRPTTEEEAAVRAAVPAQPLHLAALLSGRRVPKDWEGAGRAVDARDAVELALLVGEVLGVPLAPVADPDRAPFHPGRCVGLHLPTGDVVGHAGELAPRAVAALGLPARTVGLELDLDALVAALPGPRRAAPVPVVPVVKQDVALVVDADVPAAAVGRALREGAGAYAEEVRLVDVYEGEQVGEGRRSLAWALRLRARDRTLTSAEASEVREAAVAAAAAATGAVLRGT